MTQLDQLAEHVSEGMSITAAAGRMGITFGLAMALWARIKRELGEQAV